VFLINFDQVIPQEKILTSLRLFAAEVMPAFREPGEKSPLTTVPAVEAYHRERETMASSQGE
jgi:hypothetical protein